MKLNLKDLMMVVAETCGAFLHIYLTQMLNIRIGWRWGWKVAVTPPSPESLEGYQQRSVKMIGVVKERWLLLMSSGI